MGIKNKYKTTRKKVQILKRKVTASAMSFTPLHFLIKNRRAVSAVMSNLILIGAVMAVGLVVLAYARSTSVNYQEQYGQSVGSDISKLKETITFEYVTYKTSSLYIYFMNSGNIGNFSVKTVLLSNSTWSTTFQAPQIQYFNGTQTSTLGVGAEGCIILNKTLPNGQYTVKLTTERGSTFAYNFLV